jgi:uncharacterized membrane protein
VQPKKHDFRASILAIGILIFMVIGLMSTYVYLNGYLTTQIKESDEPKKVDRFERFLYYNKGIYSILIIVIGKLYKKLCFDFTDLQNF